MDIRLKKINDVRVAPPPISVQIKSALSSGPANPLFTKQYPNVLMIGKKESGKTNMICNILKQLMNENTIIVAFCQTIEVAELWKYMCDKYKDRLVKYNNIVETTKEGKKINNLEAFTSFMSDKKREKEGKEYIIIFDDISSQLRDKWVETFVKQNRHYKSKCIISTQAAKDVSPNVHKMINVYMLLSGIPDEGIEHISKNTNISCNKDRLLKLYKECTIIPHHFLYIDADNEEYRLNFDKEIENPMGDNNDESEPEEEEDYDK